MCCIILLDVVSSRFNSIFYYLSYSQNLYARLLDRIPLYTSLSTRYLPNRIFQTALNLRQAKIIFARQKCFYLMIPLCLNACQHMTWHVSAQVARTDSRAFVKCKQGLPASFTVWLSFHFPASRGLSRRGKNERPLLAGNHFIFRQNRKSRSSSFGLFFTSKPNGNAGGRVTLSTLLAG